MPEENPATFFMISLIIQQLYREILAVADENGGKLKNRCVFFCDEFGTLPKIESAEMMFSASRSRRLQIVPIIQSFSQLRKELRQGGGGDHHRQHPAHHLRRVCSPKYFLRKPFPSPGQLYRYVRLGVKEQERSVGIFADDRAAADDAG